VNKLLKTLLIGAVIAGGLGSVATAADAPDPILGTWKLDTAKSKFTPGPAPKSQTRTYAETAQGTAMTFTGVAANGSAMSGQSTFKYDGKDYKITGSADYDALSLKRLNGSTVRADLKKGGKVVGTTIRTLSGHGKVLTLASRGTGATGAAFDDVMVFNKQ
jgi:opacity protein-like surface antigen